MDFAEGLRAPQVESALSFASECILGQLEAPRALEIAEETYRQCQGLADGDVRPDQRDELLAVHASLLERVAAGTLSQRDAQRTLAAATRRIMGWTPAPPRAEDPPPA